ncbi:uncharacterized protein UV8b_01737 [Ustilaginoidea virens]|uniref:Uncharacterized protein n=1 Tax=Ustilaginoidea virens TaxID=1159556 RepID=A0A8E5MFH4_USTVR|nr:uncharacterized protein UV8b_01737 [Ustilaginoidea virens]QUC17496.1 hypothetical protein UV8b_01737 [Ustilaginoidea virens]
MSTLDDAHISVRFKHGIHTIYLFVDAEAPMSEVSKELVELLRERYPEGLKKSLHPAGTTEMPSEPVIAYGVLNIPNDPSKGWKKIKIGEDGINTPTKCGIKNNSIIAFMFVTDPDEEVTFEVEWPMEEDEAYDQGT